MKRIASVLGSAGVFLSLTMCGGGDAPAPEATRPAPVPPASGKYELNIGSLAPDPSPWFVLLKEMEARIEKESEGRIEVIIRPPGVMGEVEMVRETRKGERLQGCGVTAAAIAEGGNVPQLGLLELPYLYATNEEADHVLDDIVFDDMDKALGKKGFTLVMWSENGWRSFATTNKPILTPDDLKGVKMRSQESDVHMEMYKAYGAQAVQKPMTEVATALQAGLIDGLDNTPLFIVAGRLNEPLKQMTLTDHIYQPAAIIISRTWYDTLPPDLQKIVAGTRDMTAQGRASIREENEGMMELLRESLTVTTLTPEQKAAFAGPAQATHAGLAAKVDGGPEILEKINKAVAAKRAAQ